MHKIIDTLQAFKLLGLDRGAFETSDIVQRNTYARALVACQAYDTGMTEDLKTSFNEIAAVQHDIDTFAKAALKMRAALVKHMQMEHLLDSSVADLRVHKRALAKIFKNKVAQHILYKFVQEAAIPSELIDFHETRFNKLMRMILRDPNLFSACELLIHAPRQNMSLSPYKDALKLVQDTLADVWGVIPPSLSFDKKAKADEEPKSLGMAQMRRVGTDPNYLPYAFCTRLAPYTDGETALTSLGHEFAHAFESHLCIRLLSEKNIVPDQQRFLTVPDVEQWDLRKAALLIALNDRGLGAYISPEKNRSGYLKQIRERHSEWFGTELASLMIDTVLSHGPWVYAASGRALPIRKTVKDWMVTRPYREVYYAASTRRVVRTHVDAWTQGPY